MSVWGIPGPQDAPDEVLNNIDTNFPIFIPKLKWYIEDQANLPLYNKAKEKAIKRLNYAYWLEDYDEAICLAIAHFIIITDPRFAQSTDADSSVGSVMGSRSIAGMSYSYDIAYTKTQNIGYGYWHQTGYGSRLVALANSRGWIGMFTGNF